MCSDLFSSCVLCVTPGLWSVYDCQLYRKIGMLYTKMGVLYRKMGCCTERWDVVQKGGMLYIKKGVVLYRKMGVVLFHSYVGMIFVAVLV